ncbi:hypothetical protein FI667_g11589, partial [Globisporangium splendens]
MPYFPNQAPPTFYYALHRNATDSNFVTPFRSLPVTPPTDKSSANTMHCAACLIVTTTGRVLVQWESDTVLPFQYSQLSLLFASLFQFSKAQPYSQLELRNGYTLVVCSSEISQISTAVICKTLEVPPTITRTGRTSVTSTNSKPQTLHMAHLKALVVLSEFVRCFQDQIDAIVVKSKAQTEEMAEQYTVDSVSKSTTSSSLEITRQFLIDVDTGHILYLFLPTSKMPDRHYYVEDSNSTQELLLRTSQALDSCFAVLQRTSLLTRKQEDSHVGFQNHDISYTTLVLRIDAGGSAAATTSGKDASASFGFYIAIQMLWTGTFASVVFFHGKNNSFLGHASQLVRSGDLQRLLISDSRGSKLLGLIQEGACARDFQLHVGSDGASTSVLEALSNTVAPWTRTFDSREFASARCSSRFT